MTLKRAYAAAWLLTLLSACATMGLPQADTFNKKVVQANGLVEVSANLVPVAYEAGKLTQDEARDILNRLRKMAATIDTAVLLKSTKPAEADAMLVATITSLQVIRATIKERSK